MYAETDTQLATIQSVFKQPGARQDNFILLSTKYSRGVNIGFKQTARVIVYGNGTKVISYCDAAQAIGRSNRRRGECKGVVLALIPPEALSNHEGNNVDAEPQMKARDFQISGGLAPQIVKELYTSFHTWHHTVRKALAPFILGNEKVDGERVRFWSPAISLYKVESLKHLSIFQ